MNIQDMKKIAEARQFASKAHAGQIDDEDKDYFIAHVSRVGQAIQLFTEDVDVIIAAYLHDIIEDTEVTYSDLLNKYGSRVANLVHEVTHEGQKDDYGFYFPRLKTQNGFLIKFCDRASNLSRMSAWSEERKTQYMNKSIFWKNGENKNDRYKNNKKIKQD